VIPANNDISNGQDNGTQATFEKFVLIPGEGTEYVLLDGDISEAAVLASQLSYIDLCHMSDCIRPYTFLPLKPKQHTFKAKILKPQVLQVTGDECELLQMNAYQLPALINNSTTGHKLQSSGVDSLFHNWSYSYVRAELGVCNDFAYEDTCNTLL
jgi:hypothetical protein